MAKWRSEVHSMKKARSEIGVNIINVTKAFKCFKYIIGCKVFSHKFDMNLSLIHTEVLHKSKLIIFFLQSLT